MDIDCRHKDLQLKIRLMKISCFALSTVQLVVGGIMETRKVVDAVLFFLSGRNRYFTNRCRSVPVHKTRNHLLASDSRVAGITVYCKGYLITFFSNRV